MSEPAEEEDDVVDLIIQQSAMAMLDRNSYRNEKETSGKILEEMKAAQPARVSARSGSCQNIRKFHLTTLSPHLHLRLESAYDTKLKV